MKKEEKNTFLNFKNLDQISQVDTEDKFVVEIPQGLSIIDFKDIKIDLNNATTFPLFLDSLNTEIDSISSNVLTILNDIKTIEDITTPSPAHLRLSLDPNNAISDSDYANAGILYVHPYRGTTVGLYDPDTDRWERYNFNNRLTISLSQLAADTCYDVYIGIREGIFIVRFVKWPYPDDAIWGEIDLSTVRVYIDGVALHRDDPSFRLIGCIRTTGAGLTESTSYNGARGGYHCKQYVWNAQNQIDKFLRGVDTDDNYFPNTLSGHRMNYRSNSGQGTNNRFSFLVGDTTNVEVDGHIKYVTEENRQWIYFALNIGSMKYPLQPLLYLESEMWLLINRDDIFTEDKDPEVFVTRRISKESQDSYRVRFRDILNRLQNPQQYQGQAVRYLIDYLYLERRLKSTCHMKKTFKPGSYYVQFYTREFPTDVHVYDTGSPAFSGLSAVQADLAYLIHTREASSDAENGYTATIYGI